MANDQKKKYRTTTWFALVLVFVLLLFSVVAMKSGTVSPTHAAANTATPPPTPPPPTDTPTPTPPPPTDTPTSTPPPPTDTPPPTPAPPTPTPIPPTAIPIPPTATPIPPTATPTPMAAAVPTLAATYTPSIKLTNVATTTLSGNQNPGTVQTPTAVPSVPENTGSGNAADQPNILLIPLASATGLLLVAATFIGLAARRRRISLASERDVPLGTPLPWNGGQPALAYGSMPGNAAPSPWPAVRGMPMPATPAPWQAATAMPEQNVAGMESNPLPLSVGAGAVAPAYGVAVPEEPPDSSSSRLDPSLEAIMRQAQAGLFVLPGRRNT